MQAGCERREGYEPFGSLLPGRNYSSDSYNFGFNDKEKDDEVYGATGTLLDYGYRMYDTRVGRFISRDPLSNKFAFYSPYQYAGNSPIVAIDLDGLEDLWTIKKEWSDGRTVLQSFYGDDPYFTKIKEQWCLDMNIDPKSIPSTGFVETIYSVNSDLSHTIRTSYTPTVTIMPSTLDRFRNLARWIDGIAARNSGTNYGGAEDWFNSAAANTRGGIHVWRYGLEFEAGIYSTGESSAGLYLKIDYSASLNSSLIPSASLSAGIDVNSGNPFDSPIVSNNPVATLDVGAQYAGLLGGYSKETNLSTGESNDQLSLRFGKGTDKSGFSGQDKVSFLFKSDESNLKGDQSR